MNPSTPAAVTGDAIVETLTASRALLGVIARSLATVMDTVTLPQFRVLVVLSDFGPLRMGELSEKLGANQSSFSRFADRMVTAGLISRQVGTTNRREVIISLTNHGRDIHDTVTEARRAEIAALLGTLSPAEREAVKTGFEIFAGAAGEPPAADLMIVGL
ncbi:DNA-binding MarR family transcriptional regulator [Arthrobacter silviterrae]|uniref:MarR family transcriptional regulator n=1 Tax=Arthrobacter silviterrae TaxID=2026658 RepID=A0ABX0DEB4_9MICC|nr:MULTISPECIES: MarR family transcriptional regulator [Arthrobacter]MCU6479670.1 MarR family transcriptional regulator [Arthrobacter sp. A2-55]MDQ0277486.1 DNA-binding MarR family transcriptional regulator [Arthrobacter silviterrae]NGN85274.1 MarR family transcriptional regulator [Arthrobacter silviterrae]